MMLRNISIGIYYPGNSLLHRLRARTKLLIILWFVIFLAVANQHFWHFAPYIGALIAVGLGIALSGISFRHVFHRIWLLVLLFLLGAVPAVLYAEHPTHIIAQFGPFALPFVLLHMVIYGYLLFFLLYMLVGLLPVPGFQLLRQARWFRRIRIPVLLLGVIALLTLLFTLRPPTPNMIIDPLVLSQEGIWVVMNVFIIFLVLYTLAMLLTMTTSPIALIEGITKLLAPLRRFHLPVDDFALMVLISLRFIPTLLEEVEQLIKAQSARGADMMQGTMRQRLQSLTALFIPFIQGALRRAAELATALEARGYEVEGRQTSLHETSLVLLDYMVLGAVIVGTGALLFV